MAYDPRNRCVSRTLTLNNQPSTLNFLFDGWNLIEERNNSSIDLARTTHGPSVDELLTRSTPTETIYYHRDKSGAKHIIVSPIHPSSFIIHPSIAPLSPHTPSPIHAMGHFSPAPTKTIS